MDKRHNISSVQAPRFGIERVNTMVEILFQPCFQFQRVLDEARTSTKMIKCLHSFQVPSGTVQHSPNTFHIKDT